MEPLLWTLAWLAIGTVVSFCDAFYDSQNSDAHRAAQNILVWPIVVAAWILIGSFELGQIPARYARKLRDRRER